jgi:hypothetical protein
MLILSLTTDKVSLITSSTADIDVVANYIDRNQSTGIVGLADRQLTAINTATTTDVVAVPGATTTRNVKTLFIRNKHASASNDVTVQLNANAVLYTLYKVTLLAGETLLYIDTIGFIKWSDPTLLQRSFVTTADSVHATAATFATITGLSCPGLKAGQRYNFLAGLIHSTDATTTGAQFGVNLANAPTALQVATIDTVTASVTASAHSAGSTTARDTAITAQTTGSGTTNVLALISGYVIPSALDTLDMRATSEVTVANGLVVRTGSWLKVWQAN